MKLILHPLFIAVLAVSFLLGYGVFMLALLSAVVVHEFSHALVARHFGVRAQELRLLPFGAEVSIDCVFLPADKKILILLAGAFGNIVVAIVCGSLLWLFPNLFLFLEIMIFANAVPAVLNLLPIYPLDGGKVVNLVLQGRARKIFVFGSNLFFCGLFVLSCAFFFNVPLLLLCVVMVISINFELKNTRFVSKIKSTGDVREIAITGDLTLFAVYKLVSPKHYTKFVLTDKGNRTFYENELEQLLVKNKIDAKIGQVI